MQWVLIFTGFFLIVIGVYLKYQYLQISNPVLGVEATDDYKEKNRKLTNVNRELDQLIQSIDEKEEILKEKIDKFLHLEEILQEKIDEKSPSIESEDLNF